MWTLTKRTLLSWCLAGSTIFFSADGLFNSADLMNRMRQFGQPDTIVLYIVGRSLRRIIGRKIV